ncbi:MAG: class II glutamine amidotransferase [Pseudomonadota bacterium]
MCELFAKSSRQPANVNLSLDTFADHGGRTGPHRDGWGIAYYEEGDIRLIKDTHQASSSVWVRFVEEQGLVSATVISHIRYATTGHVALYNTHPFSRELGGRMHVFAHNGVVDGAMGDSRFPLDAYHPVGSTDSEYVFCSLLARLSPLWNEADGVPDLEERMDEVARFAGELRGVGRANFLYADGDVLFAHSHIRHQDDGSTGIGLHMLSRTCGNEGIALSGGGVNVSTGDDNQAVTLLASVPLTAEDWMPVDEGTVLALRDGAVVAQATA